MYNNILKRKQQAFMLWILYNWVGQIYNPDKSQSFKKLFFAPNFGTYAKFSIFQLKRFLIGYDIFLYFQFVSNLGLEPKSLGSIKVLPLHHTPICVRVVIPLYTSIKTGIFSILFFHSSSFTVGRARCIVRRHVRCIIRRRVRSLILDIGGASTQIEGHLTHQLRVQREISLK
jgi:hypothetical protein